MRALVYAAVAAGLAATPVFAADGETQARKGEARLAKMLEGKVAGEPESCITTWGNGNMTVIDKTAIVYKSGKTVWVNRTKHPESLDDDDYLVIRKYGSGSQLCRLDNITTHDRGSNFFSGVVFLDDFVPYRVAETEEG